MHVELRGVGHRFETRPWLFRHIDYVFRSGRVYALTGPSGSGKSTLLGMLARLAVPREGNIHFDGVADATWVFQNPGGTPRRTALDQVMLASLARGMSIAAAREESLMLLATFHLEHVAQRPFGDLSGGEAQRLMLARGLAAHPNLFLVDEPTAQLDRKTVAEVDRVLASLAAPDSIVVVATHDAQTRDACTDVCDLDDLAQTWRDA